jgi:predicted alpha/beta superfamily hydrolase
MLTRPESPFPTRVRLPNTERWDLRSRAGRAYRIFLAWPDAEPPPGGWDVIYLLDGNAWFGTLVDSLRMQARRPEVTGVRPAIAVGIGYPTDDVLDVDARRYDLTPPCADGADPAGDPSVGGADAFLAFLTDELGPMVDARFGLRAPHRALFGHSFGGLFALHALLTRPGAFAAYAAASPSLWFNGGALLRAAARLPASAAVMITAGELEEHSPRGTSGPRGGAAGDPDRAMIGNARAMAERLRDRAAGPRVQFHIFRGENHVSVVPAAISRALPFLLARPEATL